MFFCMPPGRYPILGSRKSTSASRSNAVYHLRNSVNSSYVKDIYEEFTEYIRGLIAEALMENPSNIARIESGHPVEMRASKIVSHHVNNTLLEQIATEIFRSLEKEQSTIKLIDKTKSKLGLDVDQQIIDDAMPYLLMRHVLVHSNGRPDVEYLSKYPSIPIKDGKIDLKYTLANEAGKRIEALVLALDSDAISKHIIKDHQC